MGVNQILYVVLLAICCAVGGIVIWFLTRLILPMRSHQLIRLDSVLYTTIGGTVIGCLVQCADYHTIAHGPIAAFFTAGIISAGVSFLGGIVGRLIGMIIEGKRKKDTLSRWIGNIIAFILPVLVVPVFALA